MKSLNVPKPSKVRQAWFLVAACFAVGYCAVCIALICHKQIDHTRRTPPAASTLTRVGQIAPRFRITTTTGKIFDSAASRHTPLLVTFFATWCGPCGRELTRLEPEVRQQNRGNLTIIAISIDDDAPVIKRFWGQKGFTFPAASDAGGNVFPKFATSTIPRTYLIDSQGRIVYQSLGYTDEEFPRLLKAVDAELSRTPESLSQEEFSLPGQHAIGDRL